MSDSTHLSVPVCLTRLVPRGTPGYSGVLGLRVRMIYSPTLGDCYDHDLTWGENVSECVPVDRRTTSLTTHVLRVSFLNFIG
jgi:hypothetical protein